jgi:HTH-type transcriptional regulator, glycine betaine synthesis regulator
MKSNPYGGGSAPPSNSLPPNSSLREWERKAIHAVGSVISFWGFKENHGRIWCLLYLRNTPLCSSDIQDILSLSKGSVSMLLADLEEWNIILIHKNTKPKSYLANDKLIHMIVHVFQQREKGLLQRTRTQLQEALEEAQAANAPEAILKRLQLMLKLSQLIDKLLGTLTALSPLNIHTLLEKYFSNP